MQTVYPNNAGLATPQPNGFFSPIPRAVYDLRRQGVLQARDVDVLGLLLDYKGRATSQVDPRQDTLAARLACSVDTIQRSLSRLAAAGLIAKIRLRNAIGRLGRCVYDLAAVLALMPHHAARLRHGKWGKTPPPSPPPGPAPAGGKDAPQTPRFPSTAMPQKCGLSEADSKSVDKADSGPPGPAAPPPPDTPAPSPVVESLRSLGVIGRVAVALVEKFGEDRCRRQIAALSRRKPKDPAACLVAAVQGDWKLPAGVTPPGPAAPWSPHRRPSPPLAVPAAVADPLDTLPAADRARLESQARAQLIAENRNIVRASLEKGRSIHLVRRRMRELLQSPTVAPA